MTEPGLAGGCLCGAVRYRVDGPPRRVPYCHCTLCRRASGAMAVVWATVPASAFAYTKGAPIRYASSANGVREFCGTCGSQLTFRFTGVEEVDVTVATLDALEQVRPTDHIFDADRVSWLRIDDGLPRYAQERKA